MRGGANTGVTGGKGGYLNGISVWALAFGCVIGWGAFVMPGTTFLPDAGPVGTICGICLAALMVLFICLNYAHLAQRFPKAAGSFVYTGKILGADHAFLAVWALVFAYLSLFWANATAFILIGRYLLGDGLEWGFHYRVARYDVYFGEVLVTIGIMWIFGLITCFGKRLANLLRTAFAITLFGSVLLLFFGILVRRGAGPMLTPRFSDGEPPALQILNIAVLAPWLFVGFETVAHSVPDAKIPIPRVFRIAALAIFSGMLVYIALALCGAAGTPPGYDSWKVYTADLEKLEGLWGNPVFYNAGMILDGWGIGLVGIAAFSALATSVLGFHRAAARMLRLMAQEELLPKTFAKVNQEGVPVNASLLVLVISMPIPFLGRTAIGWNADVSTLSVSIVYAYISVCAYLTARESKNRLIRCSGICGIAVSSVVFFCLLIPNIFSKNVLAKESYLMLAAWSLLGLFYYRYVFRRDQAHRYGKSTVMWLMMLFMLFFSSNVWVRLDLQEKAQRALGAGKQFADSALMVSSLIQLSIIVIALVILFSLFSTMLKRERELDLQKIQAEERSKAKTEFLSNMSHDIRTPMNAIVGFTDLALQNPGDQEKVETYLKNIQTSSAHLLSLINDILEMSRIESGRVELTQETVFLPELLADVKTILAGQAKAKEQELTLDTSRIREGRILCDRLRLNQVLLNLISNAIKYTPDGGKILVRAAQKTEAEDGAAVYELWVKDNGIGMSPEFAERVFEAFEREKSSTVSQIQGTGLGMAITKRIVDAMGGSITVETAPGEGSEFIVTIPFPISQGDSNVLEEEPRHAADLPLDEVKAAEHFTGKRLLLADDVVINRQIALAMLEMYGFVVEEAANGREVVEKVETEPAGYYDAVLMDIQMPEMDGYEAARTIRELKDPAKASVPILAMTANAFDEDRKNALAAGMNEHIAKPIDRERLIRVLWDLI